VTVGDVIVPAEIDLSGMRVCDLRLTLAIDQQ
jgi:hypothetical protein